MASSAVIFLDKALLGLAAKPLMADLHLSKAEFGSLGSAAYLLFGVTCLIAGFLSERISPRWILLVCGLLWAAGQVPALFAVSGAAIYASRVMVGAAEGPAQPLAHMAAYSWFPNERRGLPAALITCGAAIGKLALAPVLTLVILHFGWRAGFLSVGLLALTWSVVWFFTGRLGPYADKAATGRAHEKTSDPQEEEKRAVRDSVPWRRILLNGTFLGALAAYFTQGALAAVVFTWLPSYFEDGLGFSAATSGSLFGLPSAMAIVALLSVGPITDRLLRRGFSSRFVRGVFGGSCLVAAGLILTLLHWVTSPVVAVALLMLGYGLSTTVQAVANPAVAEIAPAARRGGALGVLTALGTSAGIISPMFTGWLLDRSATEQQGYTDAFLVFGVLVAFGGLCFALLVNPERDARRSLG
ncbi:MFS transporter [Streptomyces sp. NPDC021354]|uniref:MFS transporter n=1 Tax=unclassified Streptomyces TaxID=2593676 RepID=UPI0034037FB7